VLNDRDQTPLTAILHLPDRGLGADRIQRASVPVGSVLDVVLIVELSLRGPRQH
jgi:hypothetical protein